MPDSPLVLLPSSHARARDQFLGADELEKPVAFHEFVGCLLMRRRVLVHYLASSSSSEQREDDLAVIAFDAAQGRVAPISPARSIRWMVSVQVRKKTATSSVVMIGGRL